VDLDANPDANQDADLDADPDHLHSTGGQIFL